MASGVKTPADKVDEIYRMSVSGVSSRAIARQLGMPKSTIDKYILQLGLSRDPNRPLFRPDAGQEATIRRMWGENYSGRVIAAEIGISPSAFSLLSGRMSLPARQYNDVLAKTRATGLRAVPKYIEPDEGPQALAAWPEDARFHDMSRREQRIANLQGAIYDIKHPMPRPADVMSYGGCSAAMCAWE